MYTKWLESRGVKFSKVAVSNFEGQGQGLIATEKISENDVLVTIPRNAVIVPQQNENFSKAVKQYQLDDWSALIVYLMKLSAISEYKPYFDVLPTEFNTPMFWPESEVQQLLKGSDLPSKIGRKEADEMYDELASGILTSPEFTGLDESCLSRTSFHRMGSIIMSYAFDLPVLDEQLNSEAENEGEDVEFEQHIKAMIPPADILNAHTKLCNARLVFPDDATSDLEIIASQNIDANSQVYNTYGELSSGELLRRYGYVEPNGTSYEVAEIDINLVKSHTRQVLKLTEADLNSRFAKCEEYMEIPESFVFSMNSDELEFDEDLVMLTNCCVKPDEKERRLVRMAENDELFAESKEILSAALNERLSEYDQQPVVSTNAEFITERHQMCAVVLNSEQTVLKTAIDWVESQTAKVRKLN